MSAFLPFPSVDLFSRGDYRLVNASLPVCLLASKDGGHGGSDALIPAALTISGGKIHQIAAGQRADAIADDSLPAIDLDGGMVWPVCADLHTHLDKGQTWFRAPNVSGRWQDALTIVGKDREANWCAEDVTARMDFALRCAFVHGTAAVRTHIDSMGPQSAISWPVLAHMRDRWEGRIALQGVSLAMLDHYVGEAGERLADWLPTTAASLAPW